MLRLKGTVAVLAAGVLSAAALACGVASESANGFTGDSGAEGDGGGEDSTAGDSGVVIGDAGTGADSSPSADSGMVETGAAFVHASSDLPDLRLCWKVDGPDGGVGEYGADAPFPSGTPAPSSNYPALSVGGIVGLPDAASLVGSNLTLVGIPAVDLAMQHNTSSCTTLMTPGALSLHNIGIQPSFTLTVPGGIVAGSTSVLAFVGSSGSYRIDVLPLYPVDISNGGQLPVQVAQLSPQLAQLAGDAGVAVSFGPQGATAPVGTLTADGTWTPPGKVTDDLDIGTDAAAYGALGFGVDVVGQDGGPGHLWMSLEQSLELTKGPMVNPAAYYSVQDTYLVAIIGDPNGVHAFADASASFDGTGLHVLVFPL